MLCSRSRATKRSRCSESASAACRSSSTSTSGESFDNRFRYAAIESNSSKRAGSKVDLPLDGSPDSIVARGQLSGDEISPRDSGVSPNICRAVEGSVESAARESIVLAQCRSACIHGQYAGAPPPSQHRPHATFRAAALRLRRDFFRQPRLADSRFSDQAKQLTATARDAGRGSRATRSARARARRRSCPPVRVARKIRAEDFLRCPAWSMPTQLTC